MGSGKHLTRSLKKYGKKNHICTIIEHCLSFDLLVKREAEIVNQTLVEDPMCMNMKLGGAGGNCYATKEETKKRQQAAMKAFWSSEEGLKVREQYRAASRPFPEASKPLASEKAKERMARMKADGSWSLVIEKNRAAHTGKVLSAEHRKSLGDANRRYKAEHGKKVFSEQAIANISASLKGNDRNKKQWTLVHLNTREELIVHNLRKWLRDNNLTAPTHYVKAGSENVYLIKEEHEKFLAQREARNEQRRLKRAAMK